MAIKVQAKHKFCRRIGECIWDDPKCPCVKRPFPAGPTGKNGRKKKLSTYGELMMEKQKLRFHYAITELQLKNAYLKAKAGLEATHEKLFRSLEMRLDAVVFHCGFAPSIFAAKQWINHGHILVDGKRVDRNCYVLRAGQVVTINAEKSPAVAEAAKATQRVVPAYLEVDKDNLRCVIARLPLVEEIPVKANIMSVIEYYAR